MVETSHYNISKILKKKKMILIGWSKPSFNIESYTPHLKILIKRILRQARKKRINNYKVIEISKDLWY